MKRHGAQKRLTIFVGEAGRFGHHSLVTEIVPRAERAGLAGASVLRGVEGHGAANHLHTTRMLSLSDELPVAVVVVDCEDHSNGFLPAPDELITDGLATIDDVETVTYLGRTPGTGRLLMLILALAVAGAIGAPLRYLIDGAVQDRAGGEFPFGTLVVNLTASIAVGFLTGLALYKGLPDTPRVVLAGGAGGAYSTWSTLAYESVRLVENGSVATALTNLAVSLAAGIAAAALGIVAAGAI